MFIPLEFPPGLYRNGTVRQSAGRFYDANLVRWFEGQLRPIKGAIVGLPGTLAGNPRGAHAWKSNSGASYAAFGTHTKLYANDGVLLDDITPGGWAATDANSSVWTFDNFGEILLALNDEDQDVLEWLPGGGIDATAVANAPDALAVCVTEERSVMLFGTDGDARRISWSDIENRTVWTPSATNYAGAVKLQSRGVLVAGGRVRGGVLAWTDQELYLLRFVGLPDAYVVERVASDCGLISRRGFKPVDSMAYWMGKSGFFRYAGYVEPIPCEVSDDVFGNLNRTYERKIWTRHIPEFGEVWWLYPRGAATECSHYVIYNYRENHWNHGELVSPAGFDPGIFAYSCTVDSLGRLLYAESSWDATGEVELTADDGSTFLTADDGVTILTTDDAAGAVQTRFAVSGPLEISGGERRLMIDAIIPDERNQGDCTVYFYGREYPNAAETTYGPFLASDRVGVLTTARQMRIELRAAAATQDFRVGTYRAEVKERGRF